MRFYYTEQTRMDPKSGSHATNRWPYLHGHCLERSPEDAQGQAGEARWNTQQNIRILGLDINLIT